MHDVSLIFDESHIFQSWFYQSENRSLIWSLYLSLISRLTLPCEASRESESKAYYLDDEEFFRPICSWNLPPHPPPNKDLTKRWAFFFEGSTARVFFLKIKTCDAIVPWIAAQEPLSPIRHEDKRSERQGRFGCFEGMVMATVHRCVCRGRLVWNLSRSRCGGRLFQSDDDQEWFMRDFSLGINLPSPIDLHILQRSSQLFNQNSFELGNV